LVRSSAPPLFSLIRKNTEAAPNSYTGSGQRVFPHGDGIVSSPSRGICETLRPRNLSVPRAGQANRRARSPKGNVPTPGAFAVESRPRQTRHRQSATHRLSSKPALHVGSLGRLRAFENPRSPAWRPIQSDEVEPVAHASRCGILSPIETHRLCSLPCASVRRPARHVGPRVGQLLSMIGISRAIRWMFLGRKKAFRVEGLLFAQEVIDRAADLRFEHG
jgi:hypothetical protein